MSGGGSFNAMWNGGTFALAQPEVNEWYLYGCQITNGNALMYMSKQGQVANAPTFGTFSISGYHNLGAINLIVGRDPSSYSWQGSIACPRIVDSPIYSSYPMSRDALRVFTGFPLDNSLDNTVVVLVGNPIVNKVSPNDTIVITGTPVTAPVTDYVDNWVPV
jgi:hypothetical protein